MNVLKNLEGYRIILASKSPRRRTLLEELGIRFDTMSFETDETWPEGMTVRDIPLFLAHEKANSFRGKVDDKTLVITADTIVSVEEQILGKPAGYNEAVQMLHQISGRWHKVATGVNLLSGNRETGFTSETNVLFKHLTDGEIEYYIKHFKPFDKAGAYGIQEWIGFIAVERIEGSYFNVMGLPVQQLYQELSRF